jgi:hydroxypyruvate reductase
LFDNAQETPKPGDPMFADNIAIVVATADTALDTAACAARQAGFHVLNLGGAVEGDATAIAHAHAELVKDAQLTGDATAIMSGGELTVTVGGNERGGPNQEYLLALSMALGPQNGVFALACDTDGIDGSEDNAGALITPDSLIRAQQKGLDPATHLRDNNSYEFFKALGDLIVTGPTRTNVNDFRVILVNDPLKIMP